jgi:hypothetical protein
MPNWKIKSCGKLLHSNAFAEIMSSVMGHAQHAEGVQQKASPVLTIELQMKRQAVH